MKLLKILSILGFCALFLYWSIAAISKYISGPIISTVAYKFGDDGYGNIDFPTITICMDSFKWIVLAGMKNNCFSDWMHIFTFTNALELCTHDNDETGTTTTTGGLFGNMFEEEDDKQKFYPFKNIEDFLKASNMLEITDILGGFQFAERTKMEINASPSSFLSGNERMEYIKQFWQPILHYQRGICYSFEPKQYGKFPALYMGEELLKLELTFDVSL